MTKKFKGLISLFVTLAMVCSLSAVPTFAFSGSAAVDGSVAEPEETDIEMNTGAEGSVASMILDGVNKYYTTLEDAFAEAEDGCTITMSEDYTVTDAEYDGDGYFQVSGKTVTLDLNGFTLSVDTTRIFGVKNGGTLNVKNGTVEIADSTSSSYAQFNMVRGNSKFTATGVTFKANSIGSYAVYIASGAEATVEMTNCIFKDLNNAVVFDADNASTVTLTGCTYDKQPFSTSTFSTVENYTVVITGNSPTDSGYEYDKGYTLFFNYVVEDGGAIETESETVSLSKYFGAASLTVKDGGTVKASVKVNDDTSMTVDGGTVEGTITVAKEGAAENAVLLASASDYTITGGLLTISGGEITGQVKSSGTLIMTGGTVKDDGETGYADGVIYILNGNVYVSGGTVTGTKRGFGFAGSGTIGGTITGGSITGSDIALMVRANESNSVKVSGGSYTATNALYLANGDVFADDYSAYNTAGTKLSSTASGDVTLYKSTLSDKTVIVDIADRVCQNEATGTYYSSIAEAVEAASEGDTVTLLSNFAGDVIFTKTVNFDLNGQTLTGSVTVDNDAAVTITDSSTDATGAITGELIETSGTLSITGGNYTVDPLYYAASEYAAKTLTDGTYSVAQADVKFNDEEVFMQGHPVTITSQDGTNTDTDLILTYTDDDSTYRTLYTSTTAARIFGGYLAPTGTTTNDEYSITMVSGTVESLRGGSKGFSSLDNISFKSADITVEGGVVGIIAAGWYYNQSAESFNVTVNGGTVTTIYGNGETSYVASQYIQSVIDTMTAQYTAEQKAYLASQYYFIEPLIKDGTTITSYMYVPTVQKATINIDGGNVTYVYGGGKACTQNGSYTAYTSEDFKMVTNTAVININGGTVTYVNGGGFSGPEANWGETSGQDTVVVDSATINVNGGSITSLFAGGYNGQWKFTYKVNADGELVFSNYNGATETRVRNIVADANVNINAGTIKELFMGGRSYSYVEDSDLTVTGGTITTLSMSGNYGYVENSTANVSGGTISKLELLNRNYVDDITVNVSGDAKVTDFYAGTGGAYKNGNCNEATYNLSSLDVFGDVVVNFADGTLTGGAYLTTGLENAASVNINVPLTLIAMNLAASGYTGSETTSGDFKIENQESSWTATIYVGNGVSFDRNGNTEESLVILPILGASGDNTTAVKATSVANYGTSAIYVGVSAEDISKYSTESYPTTSLTYTSDNEVDSGSYIFAGWYTLDDSTYTAMNVFPGSDDDTTGATVYYAKFVDKNALKVYCVYTPKNATENGPANPAWRFISSLESGNPQAILFKIGDTVNKVTKFYPSSEVGSVNKTYQPTDFSSASAYVSSYGFLDDTDSVTEYTVQCGWLTLDGTTVYGDAYTFDSSGCTVATALDGTVSE